MADNFFHQNSQSSLPVLEHIINAYKKWVPIQRNFPKSERFSLGQKIDQLFIALMETLRKASFSQINSKVSLLGEALLNIDSLRFFVQLCWELKLIPNNQFSFIGKDIENIGKMVGGWRKGLITKTSANAEEKK
jgi:hypothetical protein